MSKRSRGRTAWLITWEWAGEHAAVPSADVVAAILSPRKGADTINHMVEALYAARQYGAADKLQALTHNPYPASFGSLPVTSERAGEVGTQRVPFEGQIHCGHNPYLYARLVDNLRLEDIARPDKGLVWDERPLPAAITARHPSMER